MTSSSWLDASAIRTASDVALGGLLVVTGIVAILDQRGTGIGSFPVVIGGSLFVIGAILLVRGSIFDRGPAARWRLNHLVIVTVVVGVVDVIVAVDRATSGWIHALALRFGPPEFAAIIAFKLAVAIALARVSRLRALGMVLLGLLLAMVGLDTITGQSRLTMGTEELLNGIEPVVALLGLFIVADGVVCLVSPSLLLASYGRQVVGWRNTAIPPVAALGIRVAAALAIATACVLTYALNASAWEPGYMLVFGAFGVACRIFGWNRLVLLLALSLGNALDESIRHTLLLSKGDPTIFLRRPVSAALVLATAAILAGVTLVSVRRAYASQR